MNNENINQKNESEAFLEIVYDGKPIVLSKEEAVTLSQKGMNYDRLSEKLKNLSADYENVLAYKEKIDAIANQMGVSPDKVLESLDNERNEYELSEYAEQKGIPAEYAKIIKELEGRLESAEKEKETLMAVKKRQDELKDFVKVYPDIDIRDVDKEIIDEWENSDKSLIDIYNAAIVRKLRREEAAKAANQENSEASSGSVTGVADVEEAITDEMIKNMSDNEFNKNFKKILKQFK